MSNPSFNATEEGLKAFKIARANGLTMRNALEKCISAAMNHDRPEIVKLQGKLGVTEAIRDGYIAETERLEARLGTVEGLLAHCHRKNHTLTTGLQEIARMDNDGGYNKACITARNTLAQVEAEP
jgi:hypothetical protein